MELVKFFTNSPCETIHILIRIPPAMANFFPRWTNLLPLKIAVCLGAVFLAVPKCIELLDESIITIDKSFVSQVFE